MSKYGRIIKLTCFVILFFLVLQIFYVNFLPKIINIDNKISLLQKILKDKYGYDLTVKSPALRTYYDFSFSLSSEKLEVADKDGNKIFQADNSFIKIQPLKILLKKIKIRQFSAENLYADISPFAQKLLNNTKTHPFLKTDIINSLINVNGYNIVLNDKTINKTLCLEGKKFEIIPLKNSLSKLSADGTLGIDTQITSFNLEITNKFLFEKKPDLRNLSAEGYINNIDLKSIAPYLNKYTDCKNVSGLVNIHFSSDIRNINDKNAEITIIAKDIEANKGLYKHQIRIDGTNTLKIRTHANRKEAYIEEINFTGQKTGFCGKGKIIDFDKKNPFIDMSVVILPSQISDIVDMLPFGLAEEIDIIKEKGLSGNITGSLKVKGKMPDLKFFGNIDAKNIHAFRGQEKSHSGEINLKFEDMTVYTTVDIHTSNGEKFYLKGNSRIYDDDWSYFDIKTSDNLDLKLVCDILNPVSKIFQFKIGPVPFFNIKSGTGSSQLYIKGMQEQAFIDGFVKIKNASGTFDGINADLSNTMADVIFQQENIYYETKNVKVNNCPLKIYGKGSTLGDLEFNLDAVNYKADEFKKIVGRSPMLEDVAAALNSFEKIQGLLDLKLSIMGKIDNITENMPLEELIEKLSIQGNVKLKDNSLTVKGFSMPIKSVKGLVNFTENSAEAKDLDVKFGNSAVKVSITGANQPKSKDFEGILTINGNSVLLRDSLNFILNSDYAKNTAKMNFSPLNTKHFLSINAKIKNNDIDMKNLTADIKILPDYSKSKLKVSNGEIVVSNGNAEIKNLLISYDKSLLALSGKIRNFYAKKPVYNIFAEGSNIAITSITDNIAVFPDNIKNILKKAHQYSGTVSTDLNITDKGISGLLNFKNLGFRCIENDVPVFFADLPIKFTNAKILLQNITGELGRTGKFPVNINMAVENYMKIPVIKGSVSMKPNPVFVERYINTKLSHPVRIMGDITFLADVNGSVDSLKIAPVLKVNKDADISYLTVNLGDTNVSREIRADIFVKPKNIIIKKAEYVQQIMSANNKKTTVPVWELSADIVKKSGLPTFAKFRTHKTQPAKLMNFVFKKSIIKNGEFNCDIAYKNDGENSKITGFADVKNLEIPTYNINIKEGEIKADNNTLFVASEGSFIDNNFILNTNIKNTLSLPVKINNITLQTPKMNLEKLIESINKWSIEAYSNTAINNDVKFNISDVLIEKGILKVKHIDYKTSPMEDLNAEFSLDKNADLKISTEEFKIAGGTAESKITYNLKKGKTDCKFNAKAIDSKSVSEAFLGLQNQINGKADVKVSFTTEGFDDYARLQNMKGIIYFSVKDGRIPKLGSMEYLLRASNLLYSGLTTLSVNTLIELFKPFKQGVFSTITGIFDMNKGVIDNIRVYSQGINMSLYINGTYNIEDAEANITVYGKLGKKLDNLFGPLGNLSPYSLINLIPREKEPKIYEKEIKKIPDIEYKNHDVKYFRATVTGNLNESDAANTFEWIK